MGSVGYPPLAPEYAHPLISERSIDEPRPLKVIYIGAGVSGIVAAIKFPEYVPNIELAIYEKNADVGGTWFENRYPGCACDIPAHSYQLSFESSLEWTQFYAGAPEILEYWRKVVKKYDIRKHMKFQHKCIEARWDENTSKWTVKFEQLKSGKIVEDTADVLMTGIGALNEWKWPDIKGLKDFKAGPLLHSANWDESFNAGGKNVAVIGAGSSGIQIVPTLQPQVAHMDHYVRGRTWIASTFGMDEVRARNNGLDGNFTYTSSERDAWRADRASYVKYRKALEAGMQGGYSVTQIGSDAQNGARAEFDRDMRKRLEKKPEVAEHMLPDFPPLCKRLTPGPGYLEALTADNVDVIAKSISHIDATGIVTSDGTHRPVDAIVCATGFDTSFQGRFPIYGRNGTNLQDQYRVRPSTYLSLCTAEFPNFFQSLGPNAGLGNGNLIIIIESIALYVAQCLRKMATENVLTMEPKRQCVEDFTNYCDAYFKRTVFSAECGSWYKSSPPGASAEERKKGRVTALWPGSSLHGVKALERVRFEDFEMKLADENHFAWFGDGWTVAERTGDVEGMTYYLSGTNFLDSSASVNGAGGSTDEKGRADQLQNGEEAQKITQEEVSKVQPGAILSV